MFDDTHDDPDNDPYDDLYDDPYKDLYDDPYDDLLTIDPTHRMIPVVISMMIWRPCMPHVAPSTRASICLSITAPPPTVGQKGGLPPLNSEVHISDH